MSESNITDLIMNQTGTSGNKYVSGFFDFVSKISGMAREKLKELGINYPDIFSTISVIFISLLFIFLGVKVANKLVKGLLIIVGFILLAGTVYSLIFKFVS